MSVRIVKVDKTKPPSQWKVEYFAAIDASEEFLQQMVEIAGDLLGATIIPDPVRQDSKHAIMTVMAEGLMPAFEHLKRIRASVAQQMPVLNRNQLYEDFTRVLWHGYKDLMPRATKLIGPNVGFLFQNSADFEKGLAAFRKAHPSALLWFGDFLRAQRTNWQNELSDFRNHFLEHREEEPEKYQDFYIPENADALFDSVWRTIANVLAVLLAMNMPAGTGFEEIPVAERSAQNPRRFRFVISALQGKLG